MIEKCASYIQYQWFLNVSFNFIIFYSVRFQFLSFMLFYFSFCVSFFGMKLTEKELKEREKFSAIWTVHKSLNIFNKNRVTGLWPKKIKLKTKATHYLTTDLMEWCDDHSSWILIDSMTLSILVDNKYVCIDASLPWCLSCHWHFHHYMAHW